jgi:murein DD-endopeptidase MepM/ murein hydrolase activator NlpD
MAELLQARRVRSGLAIVAAVAASLGSALPASGAPTTSTIVSSPTTIVNPGTPQPTGVGAPLPIAPAPAGFPVPVPPAKGAPLPPPLDWLTAAHTSGAAVSADHGGLQQLANAKAALDSANAAADAAGRGLAQLEVQIEDARDALKQLDAQRADIVTRQQVRAVDVYMSGSGGVALGTLIAPPTVVDGRRTVYAEAAQTVDSSSIDRVNSQHRAEAAKLDALAAQEHDARGEVVAANQQVGTAFGAFAQLNAVVTDAAHGGRVFPVDGKYDFVDSWGFYRAEVYAGTTSHGHHATDIMAPLGTPIVAIESGTLNRVGWNRLGGWRLWIKGVSGTNYYYAHMSAYAPGLKEGTPVLAGQYLGRVGNTGDAQGGPTHLHIEVHVPTPPAYRTTDPDADGWAVNPYPLLCVLAGAPVPPIPPNDPPASATNAMPSTTTSTVAPRHP